MFSYWEQQSFLHYDHIIAGAGIVGLHVAIELKERSPGQRVLVLERSLFPFGASTRNAGFACMGSLTELLDDLNHQSPEEALRLFRRRKEGLNLLRSRLGDAAIDYREQGSYELIMAKEEPMLARMEELNGLLRSICPGGAFKRADQKIAAFGFSKQQVCALVENTAEGALHTGKMMRRLTDYALSKGIEIKTGATVSRFEEETEQVIVWLNDPVREVPIRLTGGRLYLCTNAFTGQLLPEAAVRPGRGQVLLTDPVPGLPFKGIFHFDEGYYYFRELDGRVLFGGGRQHDIEGETTHTIALHEGIQADLEEKLRRLILPGRPFTVAQRWAGIMAFGPVKSPEIRTFSPRVSGAFRMGGMGVALGALAARELVDLATDL